MQLSGIRGLVVLSLALVLAWPGFVRGEASQTPVATKQKSQAAASSQAVVIRRGSAAKANSTERNASQIRGTGRSRVFIPGRGLRKK